MSLNEIYDASVGGSANAWRDIRVNDLNIANNLNINTTGATFGDVLELDASLEPIWVPYSGTSAVLADSCIYPVNNTSIPFTASTNGINLTFGGAIHTSASYVVVGGKIQIQSTGKYLIFVNVNIQASANSTALTIGTILLQTTSGSVVTTIGKGSSPVANQNIDAPRDTTINYVQPATLSAGDLVSYRAYPVNQTVNTTIISNYSNITIMRIG